MKETTINAPFAGVIRMMSDSDVLNSLSGSCNLVCNMLNDFSSRAVDQFVSEFISDNGPMLLEHRDLEEYANNPDLILQDAAWHLATTIEWCTDMDYDRLLRIAQFQYSGEDHLFIFAFPVSNTITRYIIIGADSINDAIETLQERYDIDEILEYNLLATIEIKE